LIKVFGVELPRIVERVAGKVVDEGLAEIDDDDSTVGLDHDIPRLEVAMGDRGLPPESGLGLKDILEDAKPKLLGR
jgi:hypothetical protein